MLFCLVTLPTLVFGQGLINFGSIPNGTVINSNDFQSLGVLLLTDPGQTFHSSGSSLVASGNGHVTIEFTLPGTVIPGGVPSFAIYVVDNRPGGANYTVTAFDANHQQMIQIGNNHDYLAGDGYSFAPDVHTIEFVPADPAFQFINSISFPQIQAIPEPTTALLVITGVVLCLPRLRRR